jgi:hypothetical protein
VAAAEVNLCHPLWLIRNTTLIDPRNGTALRCFGEFDTSAAASEVILGLMVMLYGGLQAVCSNNCTVLLREAMTFMSNSKYSAWSA